jgi:ATP-dependent helicase/nuclease subunit A
MPTELRLPFDDVPAEEAGADTQARALIARDESARAAAIDPSRNVVLEASAGTGKTYVLVTRYINLIRAGVDPSNILAITFTRKAAAEMRERILAGLRSLARHSPADEARWRTLRDRLSDISISTIDAFCFALLREFPLEADLDPGFDVADETVMPRLVEEALDGSLRAGRRLAASDADVALLLASLGERPVRLGLGRLLDRRLSAGTTIRRFLAATPGPSPEQAFDRLAATLRRILGSIDGGVERFIADGPVGDDRYALLAADLRAAAAGLEGTAAASPVDEAPAVFPARAILDRVGAQFLKPDGTGRTKPGFLKRHCASPAAWTRYSLALASASPLVADAFEAFERDINRAMVRAVWRLFRIARARYRRALETQSSVDFPEGLARAVRLLRQMDEFAQSRYRLEARYHHVLVDEFQDTNVSQWRLVARLIESWGEGMGLAHDGPLQPSIFIVGDRKQSIYGFRDADVRVIRHAGRYIAALRPTGRVRRSISRSFRSAPELLAFTNDLFTSIDAASQRPDAFRYTDRDRFPIDGAAGETDRLGLLVSPTPAAAAEAMAAEIAALLASGTVRDRQSGLPRDARPGDIAILFRARASHREIEAALEGRGIPTYVYKGLGFFDADEVKDLVALLRYLANPSSPLRAAAMLRSRIVRLSDPGVRRLADDLGPILGGRRPLPADLGDEDRRVLGRLLPSLRRWLPLVDRLPPAEVLDRVIDDAAYAFEVRGPRAVQARENLKKIRAMTRRLQNRGYATMARVADHLDRLSAGDESNAVVDALDAVNLMTVHAAKGLEFPIVFVTHLTRGTGGRGEPVLMVRSGTGTPMVSVGGGLPDAERAAAERDKEETKRLLYVAVTRARERLYLGAVLKNGICRAGAGSLAEVLPTSMRDLFAAAVQRQDGDRLEWQAERGGAHRFRVIAATAPGQPDSGRLDRDRAEGGAAPAPLSDFAPLTDMSGQRRAAVAAWASEQVEQARPREASGATSRADRVDVTGEAPVPRIDASLLGTLVHRLFAAAHGRPGADAAWLAGRAESILSAGDAAEANVEAMVSEAVALVQSLRERPDVSALLAGADCHFEVPFSVRLSGAGEEPEDACVLRGSIDCVALRPDGRVSVVEMKTGNPRAWHEAQLAAYVNAAKALFPGRPVDGHLIHARMDATGTGGRASNQVGEPKSGQTDAGG